MWATGRHRVVVIERDAGSGVNAMFRKLYLVDLRSADADGFLAKTQVVDLAAIPDPEPDIPVRRSRRRCRTRRPVLGHV
jgi:hypothetical protein